MMFGGLTEAIFVILLWVAAWGLIEMIIDILANGNLTNRAVIYLIILVVSITALYYFVYSHVSSTVENRK